MPTPQVGAEKERPLRAAEGEVGRGRHSSALVIVGQNVELADGVRGLVHVSEIADRRISHPREILSLGDEVKVVVLEVDTRRQRLRLSINQVDALESEAHLAEFRQRQQQEQEVEQGSSAMLEALRRANLTD